MISSKLLALKNQADASTPTLQIVNVFFNTRNEKFLLLIKELLHHSRAFDNVVVSVGDTAAVNGFKRELAIGKLSELYKWSRNTPGDTQSVKTRNNFFLVMLIRTQ